MPGCAECALHIEHVVTATKRSHAAKADLNATTRLHGNVIPPSLALAAARRREQEAVNALGVHRATHKP